jgi:ferredoxin
MESVGAKYFGKYLSTTDACNSCQICVKNCPTGNIIIKEKELWFDKKCVFCLRCVYNCPQNALSNRYLNFMILKDGYDISKVIDNPDIKANFLSKNTKGYFKHFYKNLTHL